ncbi:unnamed protein product [Closterium sp. NIES-65]|nr:unnamed protein product [Closterium sp. NIES-65]
MKKNVTGFAHFFRDDGGVLSARNRHLPGFNTLANSSMHPLLPAPLPSVCLHSLPHACTPFRVPALPFARRNPLRPSPSLPPSPSLMPIALPSTQRIPFRHRPPFCPSHSLVLVASPSAHLTHFRPSHSLSPSHCLSPVALPSACRPPFRPSPSLRLVALASSHCPLDCPPPYLPLVTLPSARCPPLSRRAPCRSSPTLLLIPSPSPYLSPLIALAFATLSLPGISPAPHVPLPPILFPVSPGFPALLPPIL